MNEDILKLENQLCFPLYAAARAVVNSYKPLLDEIDLTYTQYITMMVMWEHKNVSFKELEQYLYLDSGTLTPLLKRLESKGFIMRRRSHDDERMVNITITEAGDKLRKKALEVPLRLEKSMPLSREEAGMLYTLLYKILKQTD